MTEPRDPKEVAPGINPTDPNRERILASHGAAIDSGQDGYFDPVSGLFVMTAAYHLNRGTCCESSCRHCPY